MFVPRNSLQVVCFTVKCAQAEGAAREARKRAKEARTRLREGRAKAMSLGQAEAKAQKDFNAYIRERDYDCGCISCDTKVQKSIRYTLGGQWHAGHWKTVGAHPELRFNEFNVNKQCNKCNWADGGSRDAYQVGLVKKYGQAVVDLLNQPHPPVKRTVAEVLALGAHYRSLRRQKLQARLHRQEAA